MTDYQGDDFDTGVTHGQEPEKDFGLTDGGQGGTGQTGTSQPGAGQAGGGGWRPTEGDQVPGEPVGATRTDQE